MMSGIFWSFYFFSSPNHLKISYIISGHKLLSPSLLFCVIFSCVNQINNKDTLMKVLSKKCLDGVWHRIAKHFHRLNHEFLNQIRYLWQVFQEITCNILHSKDRIRCKKRCEDRRGSAPSETTSGGKRRDKRQWLHSFLFEKQSLLFFFWCMTCYSSATKCHWLMSS